ncbi:hypothetical protein BT96DRAFT_960747 [Gymnopus androsaceus JB14]|uniref:Uncharacterized protein n=1 Tax=Gymnopus androsaceus JB14 TaxID=1447944 RepID=A0A6A4GIF4_9AGAR|nr:hypothetical protein BT96DRAFT_960747 [Gymnopus androsaceus JB14]
MTYMLIQTEWMKVCCDLLGFSTQCENKRADTATITSSKTPLDGFKEVGVDIQVPSSRKNAPPGTFTVPGLLHCDLLSIIIEAFAHPLASKYHLSPFRLFHQLPGADKEHRVYGEVYTSEAFIQEHDKVQRTALSSEDKECKLECVVAALMFWSDSTHLAQFGNAKLWPIYMMMGNLSKYIWSQPNSQACHHIAYIPSLPNNFQDWAKTFCEKWSTKSQKTDIITHCRRELMHAVWKLLLTDKFIHAYKYGIVIMCADGIERRVFPRFFTYSADYPEKLCPCPCCFIPKSFLDRVGADLRYRVSKTRYYLINTFPDEHIYTLGRPIGGKHVQDLLKETSSVPTLNAFVDRLGLDFNPSKMLVVDLLHEFELGVWKMLFTHAIRLLYASNGSEKVELLNERYRQLIKFSNLLSTTL